MKVLVIGGTRFIGAAAVNQLADAGHEVTVFHRGQTEASLPDSVRHLHGDRAQLDAQRRELESLGADVTIDMVARTEAEAEATVRVLADATGKLVVASSIDVYRSFERLCGLGSGSPDPMPLPESAPLRESRYPRRESAAGPEDWRYDYDKILVERACRCGSLPVTILRLPFVYGPGDYRRRLAPLLERMDRGEEIELGRAQAAWRSSRGHVHNIAAAIVRAASDVRANGRTYNVGESPALSEAEWVAAVGERAGWTGRVVVTDRDDPPTGANWAHHLVVDTAALREELDYEEPVDFDRGLLASIAWERAQSGSPGAAP